MLTNARLDSERLAQLMATMVTFDWAKPVSQSGDDVKRRVVRLDREWHVRAWIAQQNILREPPSASSVLGAGSFMEPARDVLAAHIRQIGAAAGNDFHASLSFRMEDGMFAKVHGLGENHYAIEIGLALLVQLFQGAITLSQPGSKSSADLPDPYTSKYGKEAAGLFDSQAPLLQALGLSAFRHLLPEEPWRRLLAYELFSQALEFICQHELGHARRGHLEFLQRYGLPSERTEDGSTDAAMLPLTHQLLESQADDHASSFIVAKWRYLAETHSFHEGPLMLSRYGFCVTSPQHAHLVLGYAVTLLFFILDAVDRRAQLVGAPLEPKKRLYPSAAYRSWRFLRWQRHFGVQAARWLETIGQVRDDLAADRFPHAEAIFAEDLDESALEAYDKSLGAHAEQGEGRELLDHERAHGSAERPQAPLLPPRFWGERKPSIGERLKRLMFRSDGHGSGQ
jgi:hypothetical protein